MITTVQYIAIANDHTGYQLKCRIIKHINATTSIRVINLENCGCDSTKPVDYPDYAYLLTQKILKNTDFGILICKTGIGMSIAANRYQHIRAALCHNLYSAYMSRIHNNANVLVLRNNINNVFKIINIFLTTEYKHGRHSSRIAKLTKL